VLGVALSEVFSFDSMPTIETDRVVLREIRRELDLNALFDLFADVEVAQYTDTGPFKSMGEATEVMDWIGEIFADCRGMRWALSLASDPDTLVGTAGYNQWDRGNNSAAIGYDLARRYWGQGLMTEALEAMLRFGFDAMSLNRIEADVTVGNDASVRVLEKLGFQREGLSRQRGYWKGSYHDLWLFSLLRDEIAI
jgi:ribosomal-protein-alanine N-acetyltransferase